jgi:hypothetical protein
MITSTADGRLRISRQTLREAGFTPGNRISIVRNSQNSISIVPSNSVRSVTDRVDYRVEQDGRARISNSAIRRIGVRSRRKSPSCSVSKKMITVSL